jgi:hypothetical protein
MARRQGATREHVPLRPATEKQRRRRPIFNPTLPGRGSLGEFPRRSLGQYRSGYRRFARSSKFAQTPRGDCKVIPVAQH